MTLVCVHASQWKTSPTMKVQSMTIQKLLKLNVLKIPKAKRIVNNVSTRAMSRIGILHLWAPVRGAPKMSLYGHAPIIILA